MAEKKLLQLRKERLRGLTLPLQRLETPKMGVVQGDGSSIISRSISWISKKVCDDIRPSIVWESFTYSVEKTWESLKKITEWKSCRCGDSGPDKAYCFSEGTFVRVPQGFRRIETLAEGDQILGVDLLTGQVKVAEVLKLDRHEGDFELFSLTLDDQDETLHVTSGHRFRTGESWSPVEELSNGIRCEAIQGRRCAVSGFENRPIRASRVFNVRVKGLGNYFVGKAGLLVRDH